MSDGNESFNDCISAMAHRNSLVILSKILLVLFVSFSSVSACTHGSIGPNPDDSTCSTYIQCNHGQALVRPCSSGLLFNPKITACDWPYNVDCGSQPQPSTTSSPEVTTTASTNRPSTTSTSRPSTTSTSRPSSTTSTIRPTSTTSTSAPPPSNGDVKFAPYFDVNLQGPSMYDAYTKSGQKDFVLAFAIGSSEGCVPKWGGTVNIDDPSVIDPVRKIQAAGGHLIVATGGAMGPYFEQLCSTVETLAAAYKKVLDTVRTNHLDVDIESTVDMDRVNQALAAVQKERPSTTVSYTLMVQAEDYGLTPALGVDVLTNAKKNGVRVDYVNPMTMEFGGPSSDFGDSVINAAKSVLVQMKTIWPEKSDAQLKKMLGVTPMIGRNFNGKVFQPTHANKLVAWANQNGIGRLHFWSVGRDNGKCAGGGVSATCSSVSQGDYEFTKIFQGFR